MRNRNGRRRQLWLRSLILWVSDAAALQLLAGLLGGFTLTGWRAGLLAVLLVALANAVVAPIFTYFTLRITVYTLGLFTLPLNALLVWVVSLLVPGFEITGIGSALAVATGLTAASTLVAGLLSIDDEDTYAHHLRGLVRRHRREPVTDRPGVIFIEIDGLAERVLRKAIDEGHMPTIAGWLESGTHGLIEWETDLSCQTGGSQAGILHGNNDNIPAFRWVEKRNGGKVMSCSAASDVALLEERHSNGNGLLSGHGRSRGNLFSGDAERAMFTVSRLKSVGSLYDREYYAYFSRPYNFTRTITLMLWDMVLELHSQFRQWRKNVRPRMRRSASFLIIRASTCVFLRDLTTHTLIADMLKGEADVVYASYLAYDEVAHHAGIEDDDTFRMLHQVDKQIRRLEKAASQAARPYELVVLSDHGQSKGSTFRQRYGIGLEDLVRSLTPRELSIHSELNNDEGWLHLSNILTDNVQDTSATSSKMLRTLLRGRMYEGSVLMGPEREKARRERKGRAVSAEDAHVIVLASGNLGLIYFTDWNDRMTYEEIEEAFPNLILGLVQHAGIGFVAVRSEEYGGLVVGPRGVHRLDDDTIEGEDPLSVFPPNSARHIRRTDGFPYAPDILVNSFYDPDTGEGAAFEELIGFHGGLGGNQTRPFLLYPADWKVESETIVGSETLHAVLKDQLERLRADA